MNLVKEKRHSVQRTIWPRRLTGLCMEAKSKVLILLRQGSEEKERIKTSLGADKFPLPVI